MAIKESALSAITSIAQGDFIRVVSSVGASRRITFANLLNAINTKTSITVTAATNVVIDVNKSYKCGKVLFLNVKGHATSPINNGALFTLSGASLNPVGFTFPIGLGIEWNITGVGYGYVANAQQISGRVGQDVYFHIVTSMLVD